MAAIKLLINPDLGHGTKVYSAFKKLSALGKKLPAKAWCVIADERAEANIWIKRKHDKGMNGSGLEQWQPAARDRFKDADEGTTSVTRIIDSLAELPDLSVDEKAALSKKINTSTVERLLSSSHVQKAIGISIRNGRIISTAPRKQVARGVLKVIVDVANGLNVRKVYTDEQRQEYAKQLPTELRGKAGAVEKWDFLDYVDKKPIGVSTGSRATPQTAATKPTRVHRARTNLIPSDFRLPTATMSPRARRLFKELQSISVKEGRLIAVLGFRAFLELSCYEYQLTHRLGAKGNQELKDRITKCCNHLQSTGVDRNELAGARIAAGESSHLVSVSTLNAYAHNPKLVASESDVYTAWDNLESFIQLLWP